MARATLVLAVALAAGLIWASGAAAQVPGVGMGPPGAGMAPWGGRMGAGPGGPEGPGFRMGRGMGRWVDFHLRMADQLGLNEAQVAKLKAQKLDFDKAQVQRHAAVRTAEIELEALRTSEPVAADKVEAKIREVFAKRAEVAVAAFAAQTEADKVLTAEQAAKAKRPGPRPERRLRDGGIPTERK
jgi:Spy/CpxP family protein refolding chaperone